MINVNYFRKQAERKTWEVITRTMNGTALQLLIICVMDIMRCVHYITIFFIRTYIHTYIQVYLNTENHQCYKIHKKIFTKNNCST